MKHRDSVSLAGSELLEQNSKKSRKKKNEKKDLEDIVDETPFSDDEDDFKSKKSSKKPKQKIKKKDPSPIIAVKDDFYDEDSDDSYDNRNK